MPTVRGGRRPYPSLSSIAQRARANMLGHDTFSDLYLGDLLFASTVSTEEMLAPLRDLREDEVPSLCALIDRGLFDRQGSEPRHDHEERAMRYAASIGGHLLDYASSTQRQVCRRPSLID